MDNYMTTNMEDEDRIYCNCCGKEITKTGSGDAHMDYLHVEKSWGFFSSKDLTTHAFNICEACYDRWTANFAIPVEDNYIEEIFFYSDEEITLLNKAYEAEQSK